MLPSRAARLLAGPLLCAALCCGGPAGAAGAPELGLGEILAKSAAARGGLEAFRKVHTMVWSGHVERASGLGPRLPFVFQQKRPNLTRFELMADQQKSLRVFDGQKGWKVRPQPAGAPEVQPYSEDELRSARDALVIDGPVLDAAAKGVRLALEGQEEVEGRRAYRLAAKLPSGTTQHVWIDAQSFLELKFDRPARDAAGKPGTVAVYLRNYQSVEGLQLPFTIETGAANGGPVVDRLSIDHVVLNPNLPDGVFARPGLRTGRRGITVDTRSVLNGQIAPAAPRR